jgi:hypothetical protein
VDIDFDITGAVLHKDIVGVGGHLVTGPRTRKTLSRFADCPGEAFEGDGFLEIVDNIEIITPEGEFGKSGGEDNERPAGEGFEEVETGHPGHANVKEQKIDRVGLEGIKGTDGVVADGDKLKKRKFADVELEELACHGFVVDYMTADSHERSIVNVTQ